MTFIFQVCMLYKLFYVLTPCLVTVNCSVRSQSALVQLVLPDLVDPEVCREVVVLVAVALQPALQVAHLGQQVADLLSLPGRLVHLKPVVSRSRR